jgi:hypothetical protein
LQLQEFSLRNLTVVSSTAAARRSPHRSKPTWATSKDAALRVNSNIDGAPIFSKSHTRPSHS